MLYDISPEISPQLAVWPGDTPVSRDVLLDMHRGDAITLSTLRATVHLGSHADAPSHYGKDAPAIHERSLDYYLGLCQLIHVEAARSKMLSDCDIADAITAPRVLFCTHAMPDPNQFREDFAFLSPDLVDQLHAKGVVLIGVDTPSVDPYSSKTLDAHQRFLANDMAILEGLVLHHVPAGHYELIALPLKLRGFDASPVRAVLRTMQS